MKISYFLPAVRALIKAKLFKINVPLAVGWNLTYRCNQKCLYCGVWGKQCPELDTSGILAMVEQFYRLGTRWISFTGGEPLLREDLGEIIKYTKSKGIYVSVSSNGVLVLDKIEDLRNIDKMKFSLDGPKNIHDFIRGEGSFEKVLTAIEVCQKKHIPVSIECVLSDRNLDHIDYLIETAFRYGIEILFQPATKKILYSQKENFLTPSRDKYRTIINKLIELKKQGAPIYNSLAGLRHLYHWPASRKIKCSAGKLNIGVAPDGTLSACNRFLQASSEKIRKQNSNIKRGLSKITGIKGCAECWCCSLVEFNLITSFNIDAMANFLIRN